MPHTPAANHGGPCNAPSARSARTPNSSDGTKQQTSATHAPPRARLGLLIPVILPLQEEWKFWRSDVYRKAAADSDVGHLLARIVENVISLVSVSRALHSLLGPRLDIPLDLIPAGMAFAARRLVLALLHALWRTAVPTTYAKYRWFFVPHLRIYNALTILAIMKWFRRLFSTPPHATTLHRLWASHIATGSPTMQLIRTTSLGTFGIGLILHALPPSVPFLLELMLQLFSLAYTLHFWAGTITTEFTTPTYLPISRHGCTTLSLLSNPLAALLPTPAPLLHHTNTTAPPHLLRHFTNTNTTATPSPYPPAHLCEGPAQAWVVVLWFFLVQGLVLPPYACYCWERSTKLRYLRSLGNSTSQEATTTTNATCPAAANGTASLATATTAATTACTASSVSNGSGHCATAARGTLSSSSTDTLSSTDGCHILATAPLSNSSSPSHTHPRPINTSARSLLHVLLLAPLQRAADLLLLLIALPQPVPTGEAPTVPSASYLRQLLRSCLLHVLRLWVLGAACWHLVAALHLPAARSILFRPSLHGDQRWYWRLVCGAEQPCCPA